MSNSALTLHGTARSGHTHRVVMLLRMLGQPYRFVDAPAEVRSTPAFLALNPLGQIPVLQDGDLVLADSNAILVYLARLHDAAGTWLPADPLGQARVQRFLSLAAGEVAFGPATARAVTLWGLPGEADRARSIAARLLRFLDDHLASRRFLAAETPTIADLACYSYVARAPEGHIPLDPYPAVRAWLGRIEALDEFRADAAHGGANIMSDLSESPFHAGERAAQARAGVAPFIAGIRDWMPDQHRAFFAALPFLVAATIDDAGWPVATILAGQPGFVASPDPTTLRIAAVPDRDDPAAAWLRPGASIGLLGIDLATRRRNRANGVIAAVAHNALVVAVAESFGNCPQYIHVRDVHTARATPARAEMMDRLDPSARDAITQAATMFVATSDGDVGADVSHRGGKPGFIRVDGDTLTIPDFAGNRYFNTLGNMLLDPRAALLIPDFATGDVLHVQGRTEIVWDVPSDEHLAGAERLWRLHVTRAWRRRAALPLRWDLRALAPGVARTGKW